MTPEKIRPDSYVVVETGDPLREKWQDEWGGLVSLLPSGFQDQARRLPKECQRGVTLVVKECCIIVADFPTSPITPSDLPLVSSTLDERASKLVVELAKWGSRPFKDFFPSKAKSSGEKVNGLKRKELAAALSELISRKAIEEFGGNNGEPFLTGYRSEVIKSFTDQCVDWAIVSDQLNFKGRENFFFLLAPFYSLGACSIEIVDSGQGEVLLVSAPYRKNGEIVQKPFVSSLGKIKSSIFQ